MIPNKVKVGGYVYEVLQDGNSSRDRRELGNCNFNRLTITIDPSVNEQQIESTFIHEILEAINETYCVNLEHNQICLLEAGLFAFIKDNAAVYK